MEENLKEESKDTNKSEKEAKLDKIINLHKNFSENLEDKNLPRSKILKTIGIGVLSIIVILVISTLLLFGFSQSATSESFFRFHLINTIFLTVILIAIIWGGTRLLAQE